MESIEYKQTMCDFLENSLSERQVEVENEKLWLPFYKIY